MEHVEKSLSEMNKEKDEHLNGVKVTNEIRKNRVRHHKKRMAAHDRMVANLEKLAEKSVRNGDDTIHDATGSWADDADNVDDIDVTSSEKMMRQMRNERPHSDGAHHGSGSHQSHLSSTHSSGSHGYHKSSHGSHGSHTKHRSSHGEMSVIETGSDNASDGVSAGGRDYIDEPSTVAEPGEVELTPPASKAMVSALPVALASAAPASKSWGFWPRSSEVENTPSKHQYLSSVENSLAEIKQAPGHNMMIIKAKIGKYGGSVYCNTGEDWQYFCPCTDQGKCEGDETKTCGDPQEAQVEADVKKEEKEGSEEKKVKTETKTEAKNEAA